jgi:hypothetical protein
MTLEAADTTFSVHGVAQAVERVQAEADDAVFEPRDQALTRRIALFPNAYDDPPH